MAETGTASADEVSWSWPALGRQSSCFRRHPLDPENRCPVAGSAGSLPQPGHLLASPEQVGTRGRLGRCLANVSRATGRPRDSRLERVLHGRDVHGSKKRGLAVGKTRRGKGSKCMVLADGQGVPLGILVASASPGESALALQTLRTVRVPRPGGRGRPRSLPERIVANRAYDSKSLWKTLRKKGVDLITPHTRRRKVKFQDGRKLRRYKRRWIVERTNSWLNTGCRRLTTRWENRLTSWLGFLHVAIIMICLKRL